MTNLNLDLTAAGRPIPPKPSQERSRLRSVLYSIVCLSLGSHVLTFISQSNLEERRYRELTASRSSGDLVKAREVERQEDHDRLNGSLATMTASLCLVVALTGLAASARP